MKMLSLDDAIKAVTMLLDDTDNIDKIWSCDVINNLIYAPSVEEIEPAQKWISVKDRLPRSMANKVLVWLEHEELTGYIGFGHYEKYKGHEIWFDLERNEAFSARGYKVTHWMPLPEPPKEG